jgi:hypothetical protein
MMPTVVFGGLAVSRRRWPRVARGLCFIAATLPFVIVSRQLVGDFDWSAQSLLGFLGLVAIYSLIVAAGRATVAPPPTARALPSAVVIVLVTVSTALLLLVTLGLAG